MAVLLQDTRVGVCQKAFYWFNTGAGSPLYIHMKTNISFTNIMYCIEAEGYNYALTAPVLCSWTGYSYQPDLNIYGYSVNNWYSGMSADASYRSSDNFIVLRAFAESHYYNGFVLNSYMANPNGNAFRVAITAAVQTSTSGNYY